MSTPRVSRILCGVVVAAIMSASAVSPVAATSVTSRTTASPRLGSIGHQTYKYKEGLDACTSAFNNQNFLSTWWADSPFFVYGMYLGGVTAAQQGCGPISLTNLNYAISLGWAIEPIWYGPQVPPSCGRSVAQNYISLNATTAYNQGVAEADAASAKAQSLGFGADDVITYDLEAYGKAYPTCVAAEVRLSTAGTTSCSTIRRTWMLSTVALRASTSPTWPASATCRTSSGPSSRATTRLSMVCSICLTPTGSTTSGTTSRTRLAS